MPQQVEIYTCFMNKQYVEGLKMKKSLLNEKQVM